MGPSLKCFRSFGGDERGTVAIIFALCVTMLFFVIGVAVDSARAWKTQSILQEALDATALATARAMRLEGLDDAGLKVRADSYFKAAFKGRTAGEAPVKNLNLTIDRTTTTATISADVVLPTYLAALMNVKTFDITQNSSARFDAKDIELSMTLDVSGSMAGSKLSDLKAAAGDLAEIILDQNNNGANHRIGLAPYSTAVNAGTYAEIATGINAGNSCVTERPDSNARKDANPNASKFGKKTNTCPQSHILPLTDDKGLITSHLNSMIASGMTAGHLGIACGWYILSPDWSSFWPSTSAPSPYRDDNTMKAAIIMTDGLFNVAYESQNGDSIAQAKVLCDGMKAQDIKIFTVGFQAPPSVLPVLKYCASSPNEFYEAQDGEALRSSFKQIADQLTSLRLTN